MSVPEKLPSVFTRHEERVEILFIKSKRLGLPFIEWARQNNIEATTLLAGRGNNHYFKPVWDIGMITDIYPHRHLLVTEDGTVLSSGPGLGYTYPPSHRTIKQFMRAFAAEHPHKVNLRF